MSELLFIVCWPNYAINPTPELYLRSKRALLPARVIAALGIMTITLASIEWHDLSASEIRIAEEGFSLIVNPYDEASESFKTLVLKISDARTLDLKIVGTLSVEDLCSMEVSTFSYSVASTGRITGTLGLLPGQSGFWEVSFADALWELADA